MLPACTWCRSCSVLRRDVLIFSVLCITRKVIDNKIPAPITAAETEIVAVLADLIITLPAER